jgi:WD40 repeat protein
MSSFRSESRTSSRQSNNRSNSQNQHRNEIAPPPPSLTPANDNLEACAATATFFLYAQRNVILVLHHDTLAIDRRFEKHKEDVLWIAVDNVSDRGSGRLVVSYDTTQTTIVWDLMTGHEVARFASYEEIRVAAWMKNSNIAFGTYSQEQQVQFA